MKTKVAYIKNQIISVKVSDKQLNADPDVVFFPDVKTIRNPRKQVYQPGYHRLITSDIILNLLGDRQYEPLSSDRYMLFEGEIYIKPSVIWIDTNGHSHARYFDTYSNAMALYYILTRNMDIYEEED